MILQCKMCGGDISVTGKKTSAECEYCGSSLTIPRLEDERAADLYNRANGLRMQKEFDQAQALYESASAATPDDAEAYWGATLCRFGVEYVKDPISGQRKPTLHRMQYDSILDDINYQTALQKSDGETHMLYEREAKLIDRIQKHFLTIVNREKPFDIFICYKETDAHGQRTEDSVYAQQIFDELTQRGYKVFFARVTLEDKLGEAYEPYIFAALHSATVMLVVCASAERVRSDWVKNEWMRFLYLMRSNPSKKLISVYRDMDASELPEQLSYLQAQDYGKIGAMQDLLRGIDKIIKPETQPAAAMEAVDATKLARRAQQFWEDGDAAQANEFIDHALNADPECASAHLVKLLMKLNLPNEEALAQSLLPFENENEWKRAVRFAAPGKKSIYTKYLRASQCYRVYRRAGDMLDKAATREECEEAERLFIGLKQYGDAKDQAHACRVKADSITSKHSETLYDRAEQLLNSATSVEECREAEKIFIGLTPYLDSEARARDCRAAIAAIETDRINKTYDRALRLLSNATSIAACREAEMLFRELGECRDARYQALACQAKIMELTAKLYAEAKSKMEEAKTACLCEEARSTFLSIVPYKDSEKMAQLCLNKANSLRESAYNAARALMHEAKTPEQYERAVIAFRTIKGYRDSDAWLTACIKRKQAVMSAEKIQSWKLYEARKRNGRVFKLAFPLIAAVAVAAIVMVITIALPMVQSRDVSEKAVMSENTSTSAPLIEVPLDGKLAEAGALMASGEYRRAAEAYAANALYRDALKSAWKIRYCYMGQGKLAAGAMHVLGVNADGTVSGAGLNNYGQIDVNGWSDIAAVAAGAYFSAGLKADGTVVAAGLPGIANGVGDWTDIVALEAGYSDLYALKKTERSLCQASPAVNKRVSLPGVTSSRWRRGTSIPLA